MPTLKKTEDKKYEQDNGPLSKQQILQVKKTALKPVGSVKRVKKLFHENIKKSEICKSDVHIGNYSVRTIEDNGNVNLEINWDKLKDHVNNALTTSTKPRKVKK